MFEVVAKELNEMKATIKSDKRQLTERRYIHIPYEHTICCKTRLIIGDCCCCCVEVVVGTTGTLDFPDVDGCNEVTLVPVCAAIIMLYRVASR
jgi:hypothetical protein